MATPSMHGGFCNGRRKSKVPGDVYTPNTTASTHFAVRPGSLSTEVPAVSLPLSSNSCSHAYAGSNKAVSYGSSSLSPASVLSREYLLEMREMIRQRLEATTAERETDLVGFAEWVSLFVGKTLTSRRTGLPLPSMALSWQAPPSSDHRKRRAVMDKADSPYRRLRRKTSHKNAAVADESPQVAAAVPSSPSSNSLCSAGELTETTCAGVGMNPESEQEDDQVISLSKPPDMPPSAAPEMTKPAARGHNREMEVISILLDFSTKAKANVDEKQGEESSVVEPISLTSQPSSPRLGKQTPLSKQSLMAQDVSLGAGKSHKGCKDEKPLCLGVDIQQKNAGSVAPAVGAGLVPQGQTTSKPSTSSPTRTAAHLQPPGKQRLQDQGREASAPPPGYVYFMQAGCPREGVRAGNWTYFHGAGEKGRPHTNIFMGQQLHTPGVSAEERLAVAGVVRYIHDPTRNAALVLDPRKSAFVLTPLAPLQPSLTGEYLEEEARSRVMSHLVGRWLACPARASETWAPSTVSSACFPPTSAVLARDMPSGAPAEAVTPMTRTTGHRPTQVAPPPLYGDFHPHPFPPNSIPFSHPAAPVKKVVPPPPSPRPMAPLGSQALHPMQHQWPASFQQQQQQQQQQHQHPPYQYRRQPCSQATVH